MNTFKLHSQHMIFLVWLADNYGINIRFISCHDLGKAYNISYESIRNYIQILENYGYLSIERQSAYKRALHIDKEKLNAIIK